MYFQATIKSETVIKAVLCQMKVNGKYKFSHFQHDLGLRCCFAVVLWCFGIIYSLLVPIIAPIMMLIFLILHFLDKYNLSFVYPIEFDSQITNRETLVKYSLFGIVCFQAVMLIHLRLCIPISLSSLIFTLLLIQAFGLIFLFRFIRKPWQGVNLKEEEAEQVDKDKIFESISSFHNDFTARDFEGTVMGTRNQEKLTANAKTEMLKEAYRDPYDLQFVKIETKEKLELMRAYTGPVTPARKEEITIVD